MISIQDFCANLHLERLNEVKRQEMDIEVTDINRPGMQFCDFYEYFAYQRPQVIGKVEMTYLESLSPEKRREVLEKYMSYALPCIIGSAMYLAFYRLDVSDMIAIPVVTVFIFTMRMLATKYHWNLPKAW